MKFSFYKNLYATESEDSVSLEQVGKIIASDRMKDKIGQLRKVFIEAGEQKTAKVKKIKEELANVTFAGVFSKRASNALVEYSNMIVIDIDNLASAEEVEQLKSKVSEFGHTVLAFISPCGNGLKVVHRLDKPAGVEAGSFHSQAFKALAQSYKNTLDIEVDKQGSDLARPCFLSHDPQLYINDEAKAFSFDYIIPKAALTKSVETFVAGDKPILKCDSVEYLIVNDIYNYLLKNNYSITNEHGKWIRVGFALKSLFGDSLGRELFHNFSRLDSNYQEHRVNDQFDNGMEDYPNGVGIGTLIKYAQSLNYKYPRLSREHKARLEEKKARFLLAQAGIKIRLNTFTHVREIKIGDEDWRRIEENDLCYIYITVLGRLYRKNEFDDWITVLACEHKFNPILNYLEALEPIEGEANLEALMSTIQSDDQHITRMLMRRWMIGLITGLLKPKHCNENVLILIGSQGLGKTQWAKRLLPPEWEEYFATKNLTPGKKDDEILLSEKVLILMDELSSVVNRKASNEAFKEMLSMDKITHRKPYAREVGNYQRKASIIGTSNEDEFLKDETGNRRFFPVKATNINFKHKVDTKKVFAELYKLYKNGERGHLTSEERQRLDIHNKKFEATNPYVDLIMKHCRKSEDPEHQMTTTELIDKINNHGSFDKACFSGKPDRQITLIDPKFAQQVGRILKSMGFKQQSRTVLGKTKRLYGIDFSVEGFDENDPDETPYAGNKTKTHRLFDSDEAVAKKDEQDKEEQDEAKGPTLGPDAEDDADSELQNVLDNL